MNMKNQIFTLLLSVAAFASNPLFAMDDYEKGQIGLPHLQDKKNKENSEVQASLLKIITHNSQKGNIIFNKSPHGIGLSLDLGERDMGGGFVYFPKNTNSQDGSLGFIINAINAEIPRCSVTIKEYLETNPEAQKTLIVGSGLLQEALQPISDPEFKNAFFIDSSPILHPDKVARFDLDFVSSDDGRNSQEKFDGVYLDSLGMHDIENIGEAAYSMLKAGGKITMSRHLDGISFTDEELELKNKLVISPQFTEQRKNEYIEFATSIVYKRLEAIGFKGPKLSESEMEIRPYGHPSYHIYAYKP